MKRSNGPLFVIALALLVGGEQKVFGDCQEFVQGADGLCETEHVVLPWWAAGGGFKTTFNVANITTGSVKGPVYVYYLLRPPVMMTDGWYNHTPVYINSSRESFISSGEGHGLRIPLQPGDSMTDILTAPEGGCDLHGQNCAEVPDPTIQFVGSFVYWYRATDPAYLRGLVKPSLYFNYIDGRQASESAITLSQFSFPVSYTADNGWTQGFSMALASSNDYFDSKGQDVTVSGSLFSQDGKEICHTQWVIPKGETRGIEFGTSTSSDPRYAPGFGDCLTKNDFSGWGMITVVSPRDGTVSPALFQRSGTGISSIDGRRLK
jgi:hypothetical protein